jgi:hypothetical protein
MIGTQCSLAAHPGRALTECSCRRTVSSIALACLRFEGYEP